MYGAGKEARTPDLYLGKVSLYQLSYSRIHVYLSMQYCYCKIFGCLSWERSKDPRLIKTVLYH